MKYRNLIPEFLADISQQGRNFPIPESKNEVLAPA